MVEVSRERRLELAADAKTLLNNPAFERLVTFLVAEQVRALIGCSVGSLTATEAHATLRALNSMKDTLSAMAADKAVLEKQG